MRRQLADAFRRYLVARGAPLHADELRQPSLVFAPHPDDETLGCGGTIRKRVEAGGRVQVAFLTDGAASHALQSRDRLARTRRIEAARAARELGLAERDLHFLDFPDGELANYRISAAGRVRSLLLEQRPSAVYVPHRGDGPSDHRATTETVLRALEGTGLRVTLFEYPVWLWHSYPWVPLDAGRGLRQGLTSTLRAQSAFLRDVRSVVPLGAALAAKQRALFCYESQMLKPQGAPDWATLGQVAGGDFLRALLSEHELFHRHDVERTGGPSAQGRKAQHEHWGTQP